MAYRPLKFLLFRFFLIITGASPTKEIGERLAPFPLRAKESYKETALGEKVAFKFEGPNFALDKK